MGILDPSRISHGWVIWYIHMGFDGHGGTCIPLQQVPYFNKFLQNHQVTITNTQTKCTLQTYSSIVEISENLN